MTLQSSGPISLLDIRNEWRGDYYANAYDSAPHSINEFYRGGTWVTQSGATPIPHTTALFNSIPYSGTISFAQFYGTRWGE
jgi:hypothetical protein